MEFQFLRVRIDGPGERSLSCWEVVRGGLVVGYAADDASPVDPAGGAMVYLDRTPRADPWAAASAPVTPQ